MMTVGGQLQACQDKAQHATQSAQDLVLGIADHGICMVLLLTAPVPGSPVGMTLG